jgi:hypothetical protein
VGDPRVSLGTELMEDGWGRPLLLPLGRSEGRAGAAARGITAATGPAGIAPNSSKIPLQIGYDRIYEPTRFQLLKEQPDVVALRSDLRRLLIGANRSAWGAQTRSLAVVRC